MGMFDYVHCKKPLPDGWIADELQTKDFENPYLEHYTIEDDGRLYKETVHYDDGHGNNRRDENYHGSLRFYGSEGDPNTMNEPTSNYRWHEYRAEFNHGNLVEIVLLTAKP